MKTKKLTLLMLTMGIASSLLAQTPVTVPDLSRVKDPGLWVLHNRDLTIESDGSIHLNAKPADGLLWIKEPQFANGTIECDIRGKDLQGQSFVGLAFHGLNDSTFDAVYFRPFNFKNEERNGHSVQYISHPVNTWYKLREEHPGTYENKLDPVPEPEEWFHATIEIAYPVVKVFVNHSEEPSLQITQLSTRKKGWIGFWVGNGSEGSFRNLKFSPK